MKSQRIYDTMGDRVASKSAAVFASCWVRFFVLLVSIVSMAFAARAGGVF